MFLNQLFNIFKSTLLSILHLGPNHLQLTLLNWDTESVLPLNKKLKVIWKFQFLFFSAKTLPVSQLSKVNL